MNILITICARGGSKGIRGKNIKPLIGKPLIHYTFDIAKAFARITNADIQLSTDSTEILSSLEKLNYRTSYLRPPELATDLSGKIPVINHALNFSENFNKKIYDFILDLDVTSPLRTLDNLFEALDKLKSVPDSINIFSVSPSYRNPYFNMVEQLDNGFVKVVKDNIKFKTRQEAPIVYDMNASFCIYKRIFFENDYEISTTSKSLAYVMDQICFDIDHPNDFIIMETLLKNKIISIN